MQQVFLVVDRPSGLQSRVRILVLEIGMRMRMRQTAANSLLEVPQFEEPEEGVVVEGVILARKVFGYVIKLSIATRWLLSPKNQHLSMIAYFSMMLQAKAEVLML